MQQTIGILGAMPDEVDQLCAALCDLQTQQYAGVLFHTGSLQGRRVVVCCAGMGKANAAATVQLLITKYGATAVVFSGIAGNMTGKIGIGDVVVGKEVVYHDAEDAMLAQSAPFTAQYTCDAGLRRLAVSACQVLGVRAIEGRIATGDQFVGDAATKAAIAQKVAPDCVEMEGAAVCQICARNQVPCLILRAMSDNADEAAHQTLVVKKFSIAAYVKTATAIVLHIVQHL